MVWGIFSKRKEPLGLELSEQEWLRSEGLNPSPAAFSVYTHPDEVSVPGAKLVVGVAKDKRGTAHGFVYERHPNGTIDGRVLAAPGVAMMDKKAALLARSGGDTMMQTLISYSLEWIAQGRPYTLVES